MYKLLNGIGNIDHFLAIFDGVPFEGMTLRLFNSKIKLWSVYWKDSNEGKLDPLVLASFVNNIAHFFTKDIFEEKLIFIVFRWDVENNENPIYSKVFSENNS